MSPALVARGVAGRDVARGAHPRDPAGGALPDLRPDLDARRHPTRRDRRQLTREPGVRPRGPHLLRHGLAPPVQPHLRTRHRHLEPRRVHRHPRLRDHRHLAGPPHRHAQVGLAPVRPGPHGVRAEPPRGVRALPRRRRRQHDAPARTAGAERRRGRRRERRPRHAPIPLPGAPRLPPRGPRRRTPASSAPGSCAPPRPDTAAREPLRRSSSSSTRASSAT